MVVVVVSPTRNSAALNNYVLNDKKDQQGERYVMASGLGGLLVSLAEKQMRDVRKRYNKDRPGAYVQAYHVIQSFGKDELDPEDPDSWLTAQKLGRALAEDRFPGRQVLCVTQRDGRTGCVHNHLSVASVETMTGQSLNSSVVTHSRLVQEHDRVLAEQGFEQRADIKQAASDAKDRFERGEPSRMRRKGETETRELRELQRYIVWETECDIADELGVARNSEPFSVAVLKHCIERTLADLEATDWASFVGAGRKNGVDIEQRGKKGRGISYGMLREQPDRTLTEPSASDRRRCSSLGTGFEMDAVEQALTSHSAAHQAHVASVPAVAAAMPTDPLNQRIQPARRTPSARANIRAALDEVNAEADANTRRMIADYLVAKAADTEPQTPIEAPAPLEENTLLPAPDPAALAALHGTHRALEAPAMIPRTSSQPMAAEAIANAAKAEHDAEKLRKINERNRRLGLPSVSREQRATYQAMTPEQRARRLAHPELFDDTQPGANPSRERNGLKD